MRLLIVFWRVENMFVKAQDRISQSLEIDGKNSEQLSPFISQGEIPCIDKYLVNLYFLD